MKNLIKMMMGKIEANISAVIEATIRNIRFLLSPRTFHFTDAVTISNGENDSSSRVRCVSRTHRTHSALFMVCVLVVLGFSSVPKEVHALQDVAATTLAATGISDTSATLNLSVTGNTLDSMGFCYGTDVGGTNLGCINNLFTSSLGISNLTPGTTYYFYGIAYGWNNTSYGAVLSFTTISGTPTLTTPTATSLTYTGATLGANLTSNGGLAITARGTCWDTTPSPLANCTAEGGTATGTFSHARTGMATGTLYYARGYATNASGTAYSADVSFNALAPTPTFTGSSTVTSIIDTGATLGGTILSDLGFGIIARGTCWGTTSTTTSNCLAEGGTATGTFSHARTGMNASTTYYTRAYATNVYITAYATATRFVTTGAIVIATSTVSNVTNVGATLGGTIISGASITARGTCWGTSPIPLTNCTAEGGTATGTFSHARTGMTAGTTYYARAYATNAGGTIYSSDITFVTAGPPSVSAPSVTDVTGNSAKLGGTVVFGGTRSFVAYDTIELNINTLTIDTTNNVLYAGTGNNGIIYRCLLSTSCDSDGDFTIATDTVDSFIYSLIIDTTNSVLYAGTGNNGIIYRCLLSTACDSAGDFTTATDTAEQSIRSLTIDTTNGVLYAGSGAGGIIYRCLLSTACDAAGDFTTAYDTPESYIRTLIIDTQNGVLYAGTNAGGMIFRCLLSTACDAAGDFTTAYDTPETDIHNLIIDTQNGVLYAGSGTSGFIYRCLLSTACDAAGDFTTAYDTTELTIRSLIIDTTNNVLYAGSANGGIIYGCLLSTACDSAGDFTTVVDTSDTGIFSLAIDFTNGVLYAGSISNGIIYRTPTTPTPITARGTCWGTSALPVTNCSSAVGTSVGTSFSHTRSGMNPGTTYYARAYATNAYGTSYSSDVIFVTSGLPTVNNPSVTSVTESGASLGGTVIYSGIGGLAPAYDSSEATIRSLVVDTTNGVLYAGTGNNGIIYRCALSTACDSAGDFTTATDTVETIIYSLTIDTTNGVLYAGSANSGIIYRCLLSTACDSAGDFTTATDTPQTAIYSLTIDTANGVLYAGTGNNGIIYRCVTSTACDSVGDFTMATDTVATSIMSLTIDTANGVLYAGTGSLGVIYRCVTSTSCDSAGDFTVATDTTETIIYSLTIDTTNGVLYAGSQSNGILYRCALSTACDSAEDFTTAIDTFESIIQSLAIDTANGVLYAVTSSNGLIYRCALSTACDTAGDFAVAYDTSEATLYNIVVDGAGNIFAGSGTGGIIYRASAPAPLTARGTCWGTSANPTTNCSAASTTSTGVFTQPRTGLTAGTTYYARAYATNAYGTSYSSDVTFTTLSAPTVTIPTVTLVGTSTATFGGTIVSTSTLTVRGTCYGTNPNPTTNCTSEGGTATGTFSHARVGLIPGTTYYARAYATNANGTGYSADISTTTGASSVSFASAADQSFTFGQADTAISPITVTANAGSLITAANDIRIKIATGTLDMRFDTADVTATVGGGASGKVSGTVSYEGGGSVLVIDVTSDFVTSDAITISGLSYKSFNAARGATTTLALYIGGPADIVSDAVDNKTVAIQGVLVLGDHTLMQVGDRFSQKTENNRELFAFKLTAQGENMNVSSLVISLDPVFGIFTNDVTNVALYKDINSNKAYDGGDVAVGGTGVVSITGGSGTITFSSAFSATGTTNYIMVGSTDLLGGDDGFNPNLITSNITVTGVTSLAAPQILGFVMPAHHTKGGGASGLTGGYIPPQNVTIQTGGSAGGMVGGVPRTSSNGAGGIDPNVGGTTIGNEFGFLRPNSNGTPYSAWTGGANAYNSDGVYATIATDEGQQSYGNFGFVIPTNNQIKGIQVRLEASASAVVGSISAKLSWDGGSSVTTLQDTGLPGTTDTVYNLGGPEDTWGRSWTPAEMNDGNFTLELIGNTEGNTISLDAVQVKVFFQASGGRRGGGGGVGMIESNQYFANVASAVNNVGNFWANIIDRLLGWWE